MRLNRSFAANLGLVVLAVAVVIGIHLLSGTGTANAAPAPKEYICHAAGPDPTQYICLHVSSNAASDNDNGGHLNEDTTTPPGHAPDIPVDSCDQCPGMPPPPSPSPTPTPTPSPSPSPSPSPA